jgi:hypothetical protein
MSFGPLNMKKMFFVMLFLYIYGLMCALLVPGWLGMFFITDIPELIQYELVPSEYEYSVKKGHFKYIPKEQNVISLKNPCECFGYVSISSGNHIYE